MSSESPNQTVADYVTILLSPALIMGLVGSLVLFLLEVFYKADGEYKGRMQWILCFYVFGVVLVGRIAVLGNPARAGLYGLVLAFLAWLGLGMFVDYPDEGGLKSLSWLINLFLVGVVWWCAQRLTWDCTHIDEETDVTGEGLLQAAGLERPEEEDEPETDLEVIEEEESKSPRRGKPPALVSWWERFQRYREERKKKRTLGVWVVYFSLAALPLFGLGQALLPESAWEQRQFSFWLMTLYVGCGLGLLLTTCFLSLRRYLRQKRLQMPAAMTGAWLTLGGGLVAVLLLVGALLPRPHAEYPVLGSFDPGGAAKRKASQLALKGGDSGEGPGRGGQTRPDGQQPGGQGEGKKGGAADKDGKDGKGAAKEKSGGQGEKSSGNGGGQDKDSKGSQQGSKEGERSDKGDRADKGGKGKEQPGEKAGGKGGQQDKGGDAAKGMQKMHQDGKGSTGGSAAARRLSGLTEMVQRIGPVLKWLVFAVLAVVVVLFVLRGALGFLAGFTDWARHLLEAWRKFWEGLFARRAKQAEEDEGGEGGGELAPVLRAFSEYANPFESGLADSASPRDLVLYTFEAVEAWAREHGLARAPQETPLEFAARVGEEVPALEEELRKLSALVARAVYARGGGLPGAAVQVVRQVWDKLERVEATPLSA